MNHYYMDFDAHLIGQRNEEMLEEVRSVGLEAALRENGDQQRKENHLMRKAILLLTAMAAMLLVYAGAALAATPSGTLDANTLEGRCISDGSSSCEQDLGAGLLDGSAPFAQTFTAVNSGKVTSAQLYLQKRSVFAPDLTVQVATIDASGSLVPRATTTVPASEIPVTGSWSSTPTLVTANFANPLEVEAGKKYALIARVPFDPAQVGNSEYWQVWSLSKLPYSGGEPMGAEDPAGTTWQDLAGTYSGLATGEDFVFAIYLNGSVSTPADTTAPVLSLPSDITEEATGTSGAQVSWQAPTATDDVDGSVPVSCNRNSGETFPLGTTTVTCEAADAAGNTATGSFDVSVNYDFAGFYSPVDNVEVATNRAKAGSAIHVTFSLGADMGLDIFEEGFPKSQQIPNPQVPVDGIEQTVTAGSSGLSYDPTTGVYTYVWKTEKAWAGQYRQLVVKFNDGTTIKRANFNFTK